MADCEKLAGCAFFNHQLPDMPAMTEIYKHRYCRGDSGACARLLVSKAKGAAPEDLFPNDLARARQLLGS